MVAIKVFCKCCGKPFDYEMYMGLCPKCGRVYRKGEGDRMTHIEEGILGGSYHIHANQAGLNRGIPGVEYNSAGVDAKKYVNAPVRNAKKYVNAPIKGQNRYVNKETNKPVMNKSSVPKKKKKSGCGVVMFIILVLFFMFPEHVGRLFADFFVWLFNEL